MVWASDPLASEKRIHRDTEGLIDYRRLGTELEAFVTPEHRLTESPGKKQDDHQQVVNNTWPVDGSLFVVGPASYGKGADEVKAHQQSFSDFGFGGPCHTSTC